MKAISIMQPWATLTADGVKTRQTLRWGPPPELTGQTIAIHASQNIIYYRRLIGRPAWEYLRKTYGKRWGKEMPTGAFIATATLTRAFQVAEVRDNLVIPRDNSTPLPVDHYTQYRPGEFIWMLNDIKPFPEPIPAKGRPHLWEWNPPIS